MVKKGAREVQQFTFGLGFDESGAARRTPRRWRANDRAFRGARLNLDPVQSGRSASG